MLFRDRTDAGRQLAKALLKYKSRHPVILALYDARADLAYWLLVRRYFEEQAGFDLANCGERPSVSIPRGNVLDRKAMKKLARWKNENEAVLQRR